MVYIGWILKPLCVKVVFLNFMFKDKLYVVLFIFMRVFSKIS
jgi:hypothetical protein